MKRGITPVVAVILLIVMTVGIAAFTFMWMQGTTGKMQTQAEEQYEKMNVPLFSIVSASINSTNLTLIIYNQGRKPINFDEANVVIEVKYKVNDTRYTVVVKDGKDFNCGIINVNEQKICSASLSSLGLSGVANLDTYKLYIEVNYKGAKATTTIS